MTATPKLLTYLGYGMLYLLLLLWAAFSILPLLWSFTSSFKELNEIFRYPPEFLPQSFDPKNYVNLIRARPVIRWFFNSLWLATLSTVLVCFLCSMAGFAFAKYNFRFRNVLFAVVIGSTIIPFQLIMTPLYAEMNALGWLNTYWALLVPWLAPAFGIFLMRQYMLSIPSELMDSARIDGCSELRIFLQIMLPLARPALAALAIFNFLNSWNSYLWPMIVLRDLVRYTVPVGLATLLGELTMSTIDYGMIMAGAVMSAFPIIVFFLFAQRHFISGITLGAIKG